MAIEVITSGEKAEWYLPQIIEGEKILEVTVQPHSLLQNYIAFDDSTLKMSYNGVLIQGVSNQRKFAKISITLTDLAGSHQTFD